MDSRVRAVVAAVATAVVLATTACAQASLPLDVGASPTSVEREASLQVTGSGGVPPTLEYEAPFTVVQPGVRTIWPGTGDVLERDDAVLLNL